MVFFECIQIWAYGYEETGKPETIAAALFKYIGFFQKLHFHSSFCCILKK